MGMPLCTLLRVFAMPPLTVAGLQGDCAFAAAITGEMSDGVILGSELIGGAATIALGAIAINGLQPRQHPDTA